MSQQVMAATEEVVATRHVGDLSLRGFSRPVTVFDVVSTKSASVIR